MLQSILKQVKIQGMSYLVVGLQQAFMVSYVLHLVEEPAVDLGQVVQVVHCVAGLQG